MPKNRRNKPLKTKLTLSIDQDLVLFAHREAARQGTTVSGLFTKTLRRQQRKSQHHSATQSQPLSVNAMYGMFAGTEIDDSKQGIADAYAHKHLR